jgi:hypothetical protein
MFAGEHSNLIWRKSSYSNGTSGACVEVALAPVTVAVRDSKNSVAGHLTFPAHAWSRFIGVVNAKGL